MNILRVKRKCLDLLERVECHGAYVHIMLQREAERCSDAPEEYPVLVQLVRGVLEQRKTLEGILNPLLPEGLNSLPMRIQLILKLGAYQLCFLDNVKHRNVVFEAVELVKEGKWRRLSGLTNAVLRRVSPTEMPVSDGSRSPTTNFPEWLIKRWQSHFGREEVDAFCTASDRQLPLYIRVNSSRTEAGLLMQDLLREGVQTDSSELSSGSLRIVKMPVRQRIQQLSSYRRGLFFIQDLSSTLVADLVSSMAPRSVRDLCAAPGGKACSIALSIGTHDGRVYATDRVASRVKLIDDLALRLGLANIYSGVFDACSDSVSERGAGFSAKGAPQEGADVIGSTDPEHYEAVLVDAPCSGFGTVGRKIDVRWSKSESVLEELTILQGRLLDRAAKLVAPDGMLIYSTCSIDTAENEQVARAFLERNRDFQLNTVVGVLPQSVCTDEGFYRSWPHRHSMAGAFAARFTRRIS